MGPSAPPPQPARGPRLCPPPTLPLLTPSLPAGASGTFLRNHIRYGPRHAVLVYDQGTGVFEGNVLEGESEELGFTTRSGGAPRIRQNAFRRAKPD